MNILILTGSFGMGHNAVARAIEEQIKALNPAAKIDIVDFITYLYPTGSKPIYQIFGFVANKCHGLYNQVEKAANHIKLQISPPNNVYRRIRELLEATKPDVIICTLPLCLQLMTAFKKRTGISTPIATCITDVGIHRDWVSHSSDLYFVPTAQTKADLCAFGIDAETIHITGIPVRNQFFEAKQRRPQKEHEPTEILIMGGGLGLLPHMGSLMNILQAKDNFHFTVICGHNQKVYRRLKGKYRNTDVIAFTEHVDDYMRKADVLISKPGGITTFEAIATETPLLILHPFLDQEIQNATFIENNNLGKVLWGKKYNEALLSFLTDKVLIENVRRCQQDMKNEINGNIGEILYHYQEEAAQ